MSRLKTENLKKCLTLLEAFVDEASSPDTQKRAAVLALHQLQKITAGTDPTVPVTSCNGRPRAE
jgi:hypothetical protein